MALAWAASKHLAKKTRARSGPRWFSSYRASPPAGAGDIVAPDDVSGPGHGRSN